MTRGIFVLSVHAITQVTVVHVLSCATVDCPLAFEPNPVIKSNACVTLSLRVRARAGSNEYM